MQLSMHAYSVLGLLQWTLAGKPDGEPGSLWTPVGHGSCQMLDVGLDQPVEAGILVASSMREILWMKMDAQVHDTPPWKV